MERKANKNRFDWCFAAILSIYLLLSIYFILQTPSFNDWNSYSHYQISHEALIQPENLLNIFGKPLFTLLTAIPAFFGIFWFRLTTVIFGAFGLYFILKTAQMLKLKYPYLAVIFTAFCSYLFYINTDAFTESLASLIIIIAFFLFLRKKYYLSSIFISSLILIRSDSIILIFIWGFFLLLKRKLLAIPFLGTCGFAFSVITLLVKNDFLYYIHNSPNLTSAVALGVFPGGSFFYYFANLIIGLGPLLFFIFQPSICCLKKYYLIWVPAVVIILFQSLLLGLNLFAMAECIRFLGMSFPFFSLLGAIGYDYLMKSRRPLAWYTLFVAEIIALFFVMRNLDLIKVLYPSIILVSSLFILISLYAIKKLKSNISRYLVIICLSILSLVIANPHFMSSEGNDRLEGHYLKIACDFLKENNLTSREFFSSPPIPFVYLEKVMLNHMYSIDMMDYDLTPGSILLYDTHAGPNEAQVPPDYFEKRPNKYRLLYRLLPYPEIRTLNNYIFEVRIYEVIS